MPRSPRNSDDARANTNLRHPEMPPRAGRVSVRSDGLFRRVSDPSMEVRMASDERLASGRFPLATKYHPEWVLAGGSGGANPLWLAEWLAEAIDLRPGM